MHRKTNTQYPIGKQRVPAEYRETEQYLQIVKIFFSTGFGHKPTARMTAAEFDRIWDELSDQEALEFPVP